MRISPFATMWSELSSYFHDPRLKQLFGRYATYCGSSPFLAPATLMLMAHVEQQGVWLVDGGTHRIAAAMQTLIEKPGGRVRCAKPVARIVVTNGQATGVQWVSGERIDAEAVVFNGDTAALTTGLLGDAAVPAAPAFRRDQRSLSAITWHLVARSRGFPLVRHNVFFSSDSPQEFNELFVEHTTRSDPTVYVCAQDRPADADLHPLTAEEIAQCESLMFDELATCGLHLESSTAMPRVTRVPDLFLAGGSVHPGPGLPMAALSGRLAALSVMGDRQTSQPSTSLSYTPAMRSGTSMR